MDVDVMTFITAILKAGENFSVSSALTAEGDIGGVRVRYQTPTSGGTMAVTEAEIKLFAGGPVAFAEMVIDTIS